MPRYLYTSDEAWEIAYVKSTDEEVLSWYFLERPKNKEERRMRIVDAYEGQRATHPEVDQQILERWNELMVDNGQKPSKTIDEVDREYALDMFFEDIVQKLDDVVEDIRETYFDYLLDVEYDPPED